MHVTYTPDVEATYVTIADRSVARTVEIDDLIMVDVDATGEPVGVEFALRSELITHQMYKAVLDRFPQLAGGRDDRLGVVERIVAAIRHDVGRSPLSDPRDGRVSVVACLREDSIQSAAEAVTELGGYATVVVPQGPGLVPLVWNMIDLEDALQIDPESKVHPDSNLGMLLDYLEASGKRDFSFRIIVSEDREATITEQGPLLAYA